MITPGKKSAKITNHWTTSSINGIAPIRNRLLSTNSSISDKDKELELLQDVYTSPIPADLHWDQWAGNDEGMTGDELLQFVDRKLFPTLSNIDLSTANRRAVLVHEVFASNMAECEAIGQNVRGWEYKPLPYMLANTNLILHTIVRLPNSVFQPYASAATNLLFFTKGEPTKNIWYWEHRPPEGYKAYSKTKLIQLA